MTQKLSAKKIAIFALFISASSLFADGRSFVWTYQYATMAAGHAEVEYYTTFSSALDPSMAGTTTAKHDLELEVGMNDHFDVGFYQKFKQDPGESFVYDGFKVRTRYRFGEAGQYVVDPLLYLEYHGKQDFSEHKLEAKMILAKEIGKLEFAINPILEYEIKEDETELEFELKGGVNYNIHPIFRAGFEFAQNHHGLFAGPTLSHGKENLWFALGMLRNITEITDGSDKFKVRLIVGVGL